LDEAARKIIVSQMYYVSRVLGCFALLGLALAAFFSVRLAQAAAEYNRRSPESVAALKFCLTTPTIFLAGFAA
jgi:hypothetical protein